MMNNRIFFCATLYAFLSIFIWNNAMEKIEPYKPATFMGLPREVRNIILKEVIYTEPSKELVQRLNQQEELSDEDKAKVIVDWYDSAGDVVQTIKSLTRVNKYLNSLFKKEQFNNLLIDAISRRWAIEPLEVAFMLSTAGSLEWIKHFISTPQGREKAQLMLAAAANDGLSNVVKALIKLGIDIDGKIEERTHPTALMKVARNGNLEAVTLLLSLHANPNTRNDVGATALFYAAVSGNIAVVKALIAAGADKTITNNENETAANYLNVDSPNAEEMLTLLLSR